MARKKKGVEWWVEAAKKVEKPNGEQSQPLPATGAAAAPVSTDESNTTPVPTADDGSWEMMSFGDCGRLLYPQLAEWGRENIKKVMDRKQQRFRAGGECYWGTPPQQALSMLVTGWATMSHEARLEALIELPAWERTRGGFKFPGWDAMTPDERRDALLRTLCPSCGRAPVFLLQCIDENSRCMSCARQ